MKDKLNYFMSLYDDLRNEIKMRISQRDSFSIQFIVAVGVVMGFGFTNIIYSFCAFLILPLLAFFYSMLTSYSYHMHESITKYLREVLEPEILSLVKLNPELNKYGWENYCESERAKRGIKTAGIRQRFDINIILVAPFFSSALFIIFALLNDISVPHVWIIGAVFYIVYMAVAIFLNYKLRRYINCDKVKSFIKK